MLADETVFYHLLNDNEYLSYFIHKSLLSSKRMYQLIRRYNNEYHNDKNNKEEYLSFCIVETIYTNDSFKHYVFIEDLGRNK